MKHISTAKVIKSTVYGFLFSLITHFVFWAVFILWYRNVSDIASLLSATVLMVISICIYCDVRENCDRSIAFVGGTLLTHVLLVLLVNWLISLMEAHWLWPISISLESATAVLSPTPLYRDGCCLHWLQCWYLI